MTPEERKPFKVDGRVRECLRLMADELIEGEEFQEKRDALWYFMTPEEKDLTNEIMEAVFGEHL
jgi:hypothetical protein